MKERILAIVGAVALVVVAVVVRGQLAGDDDGSTGGGSGGGGRRPVVACSAGLDAVCDALAAEGLVAADPLTFDLGSTGATTGVVDDVEVDAWITWNPAGAIANFDAADDTGAEVWGDPVAVASSPLAMLTTTDEVFSACADAERTWSCVLEGGETNAIAVGAPATIDGLLRVHPLADSLVGPDDAIADVDLLQVTLLLENLGRAPMSFAAELRQYLAARGTYQAIIGPAAGLRLKDRNVTVPVEPAGGAPTMALVVTPRVGASTGWVDRAFSQPAVEAAVRAVGVDPGSATLAGTPDAGQLHALRERLTG